MEMIGFHATKTKTGANETIKANHYRTRQSLTTQNIVRGVSTCAKVYRAFAISIYLHFD